MDRGTLEMTGFPFEVLKKNLVSKNSIDGVELTMIVGAKAKTIGKKYIVSRHILSLTDTFICLTFRI